MLSLSASSRRLAEMLLSKGFDFEAEDCRRDFYKFVVSAYPHLGLGEYTDGWHIELIAKALTYLHQNKFPSNSLYINVPPSHMKSLLVSVLFPCWLWTKDPTLKFMFLSYADDRSLQDSRRRRTLFGSEWYQTHFPLALSPTGDNQARFTNIRGGFFFASGVFGQLVGEHVDYEILDDVLNGQDRYSDVTINKVNDIYDNILPSRFNDPRTGKRVIICQRLSNRDVIGHVEELNQPFERIILPEFADGIRYQSQYPELNDPRNGSEFQELLWAEKFDLPTVQKIQYTMSQADIAGQYQQRPQPLSGGVFKREWFSERMENTDIFRRYIFADTASVLSGDYTCILVVEIREADYKIFIRDIYRGRVEFSALIHEIKRMIDRWQYNLVSVVIENKSSGIQAIQTLRESSDSNLANLIVEYNPKGSKEERARIQSVWAEKHRIVLPPPNENYPWLAAFEQELYDFPNGAHDDQIDALCMAIDYLELWIADGYQYTLPANQPSIEDIFS